MENYPETIEKRFKTEFIIEGIKFILTNNTFIFNGDNYLQLVGTAMGTIFAPTYATLVVAYLEIKLYSIIETKYGQEERNYFEENWDRFLDDCFIPLDGPINPPILLTILNSLNKNIQFTMETSDKIYRF